LALSGLKTVELLRIPAFEAVNDIFLNSSSSSIYFAIVFPYSFSLKGDLLILFFFNYFP
jgi:hypothetical protein